MVELDGLHRLAASLGSDLAAQVIAPTAMILRSTIRASDVVAQYGPTGIRLLLPETEEVGARTVVERVRSAAESWLAAGGVRVRLAVGWSSSDGSASIAEVEEQAVVAAERDRGLPV